MWLALVMRTCRDDLICDLAETYGILDYTQLPNKLVATLAQGLRAYSRIWGKLASASQKDSQKFKSFETSEEFEEAKRKIMEG